MKLGIVFALLSVVGFSIGVMSTHLFPPIALLEVALIFVAIKLGEEWKDV